MKIPQTLGTAGISLKPGLALSGSVEAMLTTTGRSNASGVSLISAWTGVGTGPPLLSLTVSLGDAASLLEEVKGELEIEARSGLRAGLAT